MRSREHFCSRTGILPVRCDVRSQSSVRIQTKPPGQKLIPSRTGILPVQCDVRLPLRVRLQTNRTSSTASDKTIYVPRPRRGRNVNSRGCQPTVGARMEFDPERVAPACQAVLENFSAPPDRQE